MRSLYTFAAAAAITLAAAEASAQTREVVLFPTAATRTAAVVTPAPTPISTEKTLTWPGKRESRYSPRTAAPGRQTAPTPAPVVQAPVAVVAPTPAPQATVYVPTPQPAPQPAYVYAPTPRYTPAPALPGSIYERPAVSTVRVQPAPAPVRQQPVATVTPRPEPAPVKAPTPVTASVAAPSVPSVLSGAPIPDQGFVKAPAAVQPPKAVAATTPAPAPAVVTPAAPTIAAAPAPALAAAKTADAAKSPAAPREPWRTRASTDGPRFYSVHRQFGVAPDPTRVSAAPTTAAATDRLPNDFFIAAGPNPDEAEAEAVPEQTQQPVQAPAKKKKQPIRKK